MKQSVLDSLLSPVTDTASAGTNLEYDPEFLALDRAAAPKSERAMGDSVKAAEEPDWEKVAELAEALFARTKDLRVAMHLNTAWLRLQGFAGLADGLALLRGLLENFWDGVHPQLDADDDNDPTFRVNSVAPLGNAEGLLRYLRNTPFAQSQRMGKVSLRDLRIANGSIKITQPEEGPAIATSTLVAIEACCMDCPEAQFSAAVAAVGEALTSAKAIDAVFNAQLGTVGPDLKNLLSDLAELKKFLDPQLAKRLPQAAGTVEESEAESTPAPGGGPSVAASTGRIATPQDVVQRLNELCDYYARCEPSSPVPMLLRRAQRLVGKDFIDLLKDLAPGGIREMQVISGETKEAADDDE